MYKIAINITLSRIIVLTFPFISSIVSNTMSELTVMGIPLSKIADRELCIPVLQIPDYHCPECNRRLEKNLDAVKYGYILLKSCGVCSPDNWYKVSIRGLEMAEREWR